MMLAESLDTKMIYEQLLTTKQTTPYALEKAANLGNKTVASAIKRNTSISLETAMKIHAVYPDVSIEWLRTGIGEMILQTADEKIEKGASADIDQSALTSHQRRNQSDDYVRQVPFEDFMEAHVLVREARAGYLSSHGDEEYVDKLPSMLVPREYEKGHYLVIEAVGDSMDDGTHRSVCDGDKFLVKEIMNHHWNETLPIHRNLYTISTKYEAPVVKQIIEIDMIKRMIVCHSWNNQFEDYPVFFDDIEKLFVVKKLVERQIRI